MDLCIDIMKSSGLKFRAYLGQDFTSTSWKTSIELCSILLKYVCNIDEVVWHYIVVVFDAVYVCILFMTGLTTFCIRLICS